LASNNPVRREFDNVVRPTYFRENKKICARCGLFHNIHLHHKVPLADGGTNELDNLIPLCDLCHMEWHKIEGFISFDDYLEMPNIIELVALFNKNPIVKLEDKNEAGYTTTTEITLKDLFSTFRKTAKPMLEHAYDINKKD
jgi:hypothetical protein